MKRVIFLMVIMSLASCSKKDRVNTISPEADQSKHFAETYHAGLPTKEWNELSWCTIGEQIFKDIPIAWVQKASATAYGNTIDLYLYYKANKDDSTSNEWRQCLRFSARSYKSLRLEFDAGADRLIIFGVVPNDGHEERLLIRDRFHDSFTYYIPKHG